MADAYRDEVYRDRFRRRVDPRRVATPETLITEGEIEQLPEDYVDPATVTVLGDPGAEGADRYRGREEFAAGGPGTRPTGQVLARGEAEPEAPAPEEFDFSDSLKATEEDAQMPDYTQDPQARREAVGRKLTFDFGSPKDWGGGGGYNYSYTPGEAGDVGSIQVTGPDGSSTVVDPRGQNAEFFAPIMNEFYRGDVGRPHEVRGGEAFSRQTQEATMRLQDIVGEADADTWMPGASFGDLPTDVVAAVDVPEVPREEVASTAEAAPEPAPEAAVTDYDRFKAEREAAWKDYWVPSEGDPVTLADFGKVPKENLKYEAGDPGMLGEDGRRRWNIYKDLDLYRRMKATMARQKEVGQSEQHQELLDLLWGPWNYRRDQAERIRELMSERGLPPEDTAALQPLYQEWLEVRGSTMAEGGG